MFVPLFVLILASPTPLLLVFPRRKREIRRQQRMEWRRIWFPEAITEDEVDDSSSSSDSNFLPIHRIYQREASTREVAEEVDDSSSSEVETLQESQFRERAWMFLHAGLVFKVEPGFVVEIISVHIGHESRAAVVYAKLLNQPGELQLLKYASWKIYWVEFERVYVQMLSRVYFNQQFSSDILPKLVAFHVDFELIFPIWRTLPILKFFHLHEDPARRAFRQMTSEVGVQEVD